jgi:hypothetical protein
VSGLEVKPAKDFIEVVKFAQRETSLEINGLFGRFGADGLTSAGSLRGVPVVNGRRLLSYGNLVTSGALERPNRRTNISTRTQNGYELHRAAAFRAPRREELHGGLHRVTPHPNFGAPRVSGVRTFRSAGCAELIASKRGRTRTSQVDSRPILQAGRYSSFTGNAPLRS